MAKPLLNKILPHRILTLVLWLIWLLLNNTLAAGHVVLGLLLAIIIPIFTSSFWPEKMRVRAPLTLFKFLAVVLWDIMIANLIVAKLILGSSDDLKPAFFYLELDIESSLGISFLANTISLTPGTVSCDLMPCGRRLLVHALHAESTQDIIDHIKKRYEAPLTKVFISC